MDASSGEEDFQPRSTNSRRRSRPPSAAKLCKKPKLLDIQNKRQTPSTSRKQADLSSSQQWNSSVGEDSPHAGNINSITSEHEQQQATPHPSTSSCPCCPVCSIDLGSISDTEAGKAAHVNACLDAAAAAAVVSTAAAHDAPPTYEDEQHCQGQEVDGIQQWLSRIDAADVAGLFMDADIDFSVLPYLNEHDLQELGVADDELRGRILQAAAAMAQPMQAQVQAQLVQGQRQWQQPSQQQQQPVLHPAPQQWQQQQQYGQQPAQLNSCDDTWEVDCLHSQDCGEELWDCGAEPSLEPPKQAMGQQQWQGQSPEPWQQQENHHHQNHHHQQQSSSVQQTDWLSAAADEHGWEQALQTSRQDEGAAAAVQQWQPSPDWEYQGTHGHEQLQQQHQAPAAMPLQPLDLNRQQPMFAPALFEGLGANTSSSTVEARPRLVQGSITGFLAPQQQQQQQPDVKEQWRALFKHPKQPLGAHNPAQRQAAPARQARINRQGQVVAAAAAEPAQPPPPQPVVPQAPSASLPSWWPAWRRLPGTNIIVDCFGRSCAAVGSNHTWVLTHFHADHYMGLTRSFKQGIIICTPITAALVRLKLRVPPERLLVLGLGQELTVEGTRLQLVDANHCPGAAMVVAYPPGGAPPVLHTGDARLTPEATRNQPALQALVGRAVLVLDTTYADPAYCFPPQQEVLDWVLRAVKAELFNPRCLFLFGTYTIGKERLFMHVAAALQRKVYVAAAKRSIMGCLDLPPQLSALLTTNHLDANIHAVPMRQVTLEAMESLLLRYKGRYTAVVGFKPTGWSHAGGAGRSGQAGAAGGGGAAAAAVPAGPSRSSLSIKPNRRRSQRGTVVLYQVPYSEHSSCDELRSFVEWFKPLRVIPSVNNDNGRKRDAMMAAITARSNTTGPMDAFARAR